MVMLLIHLFAILILSIFWANYVLLKLGVYTRTLKKHQLVRDLKKFENHWSSLIGFLFKFRTESVACVEAMFYQFRSCLSTEPWPPTLLLLAWRYSYWRNHTWPNDSLSVQCNFASQLCGFHLVHGGNGVQSDAIVHRSNACILTTAWYPLFA